MSLATSTTYPTQKNGLPSPNMLIHYDLFIAYGGFARKYNKGSIIFREGETPYFFYQVLEGEVKVISTNGDGKELIQGIFTSGQSFGEPPLFAGKPYPSSAQTNCHSVILKIERERLFNILKDYPEITSKMLFVFAERIYDKALQSHILISQTPQERILILFKKLKEQSQKKSKLFIPYTRQQIADLTGLRVETVIRTLIRMNEKGKISIIDHKVYY